MTEIREFSALIVEDEEGNYEPIGDVSTIQEAIELAQGDLNRREKLLWDGEDPGLCPYEYVIWSRSRDGSFRKAKKIGVELISAGAGVEAALKGVVEVLA